MEMAEWICPLCGESFGYYRDDKPASCCSTAPLHEIGKHLIEAHRIKCKALKEGIWHPASCWSLGGHFVFDLGDDAEHLILMALLASAGGV